MSELDEKTVRSAIAKLQKVTMPHDAAMMQLLAFMRNERLILIDEVKAELEKLKRPLLQGMADPDKFAQIIYHNALVSSAIAVVEKMKENTE